jgi:pilus assembly protein Flp/PilA
MKGQGLVEYALTLLLVAVVVIIILAILGPSIGNMLTNGIDTRCSNAQSFECKNARVEKCLASEAYSREECIALIGGGGRP